MLVAYLIQTSLTFDQAMQKLLMANPEVKLHETQIAVLKSFAATINPESNH